MNILVTGATGFIGGELTKSLLLIGNNVYALIRVGSKTEKLPNQVEYIKMSETSEEFVEYLKFRNIEGIVHLAASHNVENIEEIIDSNVKMPTKVLDAAVKAGVLWFINTGTFWQHYNGSEYDPVDIYAASKQAFEEFGIYYITKYPIIFCTLKLNDTYGTNDTREKIINIWKQIGISGNILDMSAGEQLIDMLHVDDVVRGFIRLIEMVTTEDNAKIINGKSFFLSSGRKLSLRELSRIYELVNNVKLNINWGGLPYRKKEVFLPQCYGELLPGWKPQITFEEGFKCQGIMQ